MVNFFTATISVRILLKTASEYISLIFRFYVVTLLYLKNINQIFSIHLSAQDMERLLDIKIMKIDKL